MTLIVVVHRSDGSGTTFNFTNYLSSVVGLEDEALVRKLR
jgi:ABC-type phosphate transport system substrate-binding protein